VVRRCRTLLEFDEIGALTKYTDRKTREAITERVALLTTQGRALGFTVCGYVQEPTKDTIPVRELFPRRICLRVSAKSHVSMVLGDHAYERGAWANRITRAEAGVGYVFGEGIREPLRVRAGWVPDEVIKQLETFITGPITHDTAVLPFPQRRGGEDLLTGRERPSMRHLDRARQRLLPGQISDGELYRCCTRRTYDMVDAGQRPLPRYRPRLLM
jgi:S-DNA-T family DNA segregation ATPase FtsK/SpoIIIE